MVSTERVKKTVTLRFRRCSLKFIRSFGPYYPAWVKMGEDLERNWTLVICVYRLSNNMSYTRHQNADLAH
jgi:hypothetical protein